MALLSTSAPANFSTYQNITNKTCPKLETNEWIQTAVPVYILIITVLGIVFNVFVLMVFCLHKKACTVAEIYLSNLAAADLVLVSCLPFWAINVSNGFNWPFGLFLCKVVNLGINMNAYCSIYFLVLVSMDRYVALVHTMSHARMRRPKYAKLGCLLMWGLGLLLSVPMLIYRKVKFCTEDNMYACYLDYQILTVYLLNEGMLTLFSFIIPIFIISYCTFKVIQALNNKLMEGVNRQKTEHKATTLMLVVLLVFLICWVPFHLVRLVEVLARANVLGKVNINILGICRQIFFYFAFFNSVLNPILYVIVGKNFRNKVRELFQQWSNKSTSTLNTTSTHSNRLRSVKTGNVESGNAVLQEWKGVF